MARSTLIKRSLLNHGWVAQARPGTLLTILLLFAVGSVTLRAAAQHVPEWLEVAWSPSSYEVRSSSVTADGAGVTMTGHMIGDGAFGGQEIGGTVHDAVFLARYNSDGTALWAREGFGVLNDSAIEGFHLASASAGGVVLTEGFPFIFDAGMFTQGGNLVTLVGPDAEPVWSTLFTDSTLVFPELPTAYIKAIHTDVGDNTYFLGQFIDTLAVSGDTLVSDGEDVFLGSLDSTGGLRWIRRIGSSGLDFAYDRTIIDPQGNLAVSADGDVYLAGYFGAGTVFGEGEASERMLGNADVLVARFDRDGAFRQLWTRLDLSVVSDLGLINRIAIDAAGNLFLSWRFPSSESGTIRVGGATLTDPSHGGAFVTKHDAQGRLLWWRQLKSAGNEFVRAFEADATGNLYLGGWFDALEIDIAGASLRKNDLQLDSDDGFLVVLSSAATVHWTLHAAGEGNQVFNALATDSEGNLYVTGEFDADMNLGGVPVQRQGGIDLFLAKYSAATVTSIERPSLLEGDPLGDYPDPTDGMTMIRYTLTRPSAVRLDLYDVLGRQVSQAIVGTQTAGEHTFQWSSGDLPNGLYLYRLVLDDVVAGSGTFVLQH